MKVNWKVRFKFVKSLRFRILVILIIIGIVPSIIVEKGIVNSYEDRAVSNRQLNVKNQCDILVNQLAKENYLQDPSSEGINSELTMLSNVYSGRILIVNQDFQIIKDTYDLDKGKYMISKEVVKCFQKLKESSYYDRKNSYIEMTMPIPGADGERAQGVLLISISTEEIVSSIDILEQKGLRILVISGVLVLIFGYILAGILIKPFAKITKAIEDITDGFQDEKISVPDYTETELITDAFNKMLGRVQSLDTSRQEFVSNVSHELKTPITSMKVLAESIMGMEEVPPELYKEFMTDINSELERMNNIINDLLTVVKTEKSVSTSVVTAVNINEFIEGILKTLRPIAAERNIELVYETFRPITAEIDEVKLGMAFNNLIENAIKYNYDDGWVRVSLNADHKFFYVKVADSGVGIPEEFQNRIFERFYRVDKARSRDTGGTGLGLAITRNAVLLHRGAIKVYSKEGQGSLFTVRIPLNFQA